MKTAIDMIEGLHYKLRMLGIPLTGATSVFCDDESVVKNSTAPESTFITMLSPIILPERRKQPVSSVLLGRAAIRRLGTCLQS